MKKLLFVFMALAVAAPHAARADSNIRVISTRQLADSCKLMTNPEHKAFCIGYFSATYETYLVTRHPQVGKALICHPQAAPRRDDLIASFVKWSDENTQYDAAPAADNVLRFLADRFPCKQAS